MERIESRIFGLLAEYGSPFWVYDLKTIKERFRELAAFDVVRYAQKANNNLALLNFVRELGGVVDAVTAGEVLRALTAGFSGGVREDGVSEIVYTADLFDHDAAEVIGDHQLTVNAGSTDMIEQLAHICPSAPLILRINPGFGHGHSQKVNTGGPFSKHGIWHEQLEEALTLADKHSLHVEGLHLHIGSGSDLNHLSKVAEAMVSLVKRASRPLRSVSAGGGLPVPYKFGEQRIDLAAYSRIWLHAKSEIEKLTGESVSLEVEPGRYLVAEAGYLITQVRAVKESGGVKYYLVDAGFDTLLRPAMYGAYHEVSVLNSDGSVKNGATAEAVIAGPLCESCDVFTQSDNGLVTPRMLPQARVGDLVVLHTSGAYGSAMSSNYNGRRLAPEVVIDEDDTVRLARRRQPLEDLMRLELPVN